MSTLTPSPRAVLASASCVGFSGSRAPSPACLAAFAQVAALVGPSAQVVTGCAAGIDQAARAAFPSSRVFAPAFSGRGGLAARSVAVVRAVAAAAPSACWVSFPGRPCPAALAPSASASRCFCGAGSGSWASLALAAGLGLPCLVFLPVPWPRPWPGFVSLGRGWWQRLAPAQQFLF